MLYFDVEEFLFSGKIKEEKRILKKVKDKGVESLTKEEKKKYQEILKKIVL